MRQPQSFPVIMTMLRRSVLNPRTRSGKPRHRTRRPFEGRRLQSTGRPLVRRGGKERSRTQLGIMLCTYRSGNTHSRLVGGVASTKKGVATESTVNFLLWPFAWRCSGSAPTNPWPWTFRFAKSAGSISESFSESTSEGVAEVSGRARSGREYHRGLRTGLGLVSQIPRPPRRNRRKPETFASATRNAVRNEDAGRQQVAGYARTLRKDGKVLWQFSCILIG
jgi:hypothetical protein